MTIILFLIDTSASMAQRTSSGVTFLEYARRLVETTLKQRQRDSSARGDRYMLLSFEDFPHCIKAGYREGLAIFHEQLAQLSPSGKPSLAAAVSNAFRTVNLNRLQTGIENYGYGRFPYYVDPVVVVLVTDSHGAKDPATTSQMLYSRWQQIGVELTDECFRWDHRLFSIVLHLSADASFAASHSSPVAEADKSALESACNVTGGRSWAIHSDRQAENCIERLADAIQKAACSVTVRFEPFTTQSSARPNGFIESGLRSMNAEDRAQLEQLRHRLEAQPLTSLIIRSRSQTTQPTGHWPIPEGFWPDAVSGTLPPRRAHPVLLISPVPCEPIVPPDFPFDKYEIDPASPLVEWILKKQQQQQQQHNSSCWQVFMAGSGRGGAASAGRPFGYVKASTDAPQVQLFVLPYDYPSLAPLLHEIKHDARLKAHTQWRGRLDNYLDSLPPYYLTVMRKNLPRMGITGGLMEENAKPVYQYNVAMYLSKVKHAAKEEMDAVCSQAGKEPRVVEEAHRREEVQLKAPPTKSDTPIRQSVPVFRHVGIQPRSNWRLGGRDSATERRPHQTAKPKHIRDKRFPRAHHDRTKDIEAEDGQIQDEEETGVAAVEAKPTPATVHPGYLLHIVNSAPCPMSVTFRNPFLIERSETVSMIPRMRANLMQALSDSAVGRLEGGLPGTVIRLQTAYKLHSQPIRQMGNYMDYVKALEACGAAPLREVEPQPIRAHAFGNPYKLDKRALSAVDEMAESGPLGIAPGTSMLESKPNKRTRQGRAAGGGNGDRKGLPPRRKSGPLGADAHRAWRERRRAMSDTSSVVSDMSFTTDLSDVVSVTGPFEADCAESENGDLANGLFSSLVIDSNPPSASSWGLDEEAEEEDVITTNGVVDARFSPPPAKRVRKTLSSSSTTTSSETSSSKPLVPQMERSLLMQLKRDVIRLARDIRGKGKSSRDLVELVKSTRPNSTERVELGRLAEREARRWNNLSLARELSDLCQAAHSNSNMGRQAHSASIVMLRNGHRNSATGK